MVGDIGQVSDEVQTGGNWPEPKRLTAIAGRRIQHRLQALGIHATHPAQMPLVVAVGDEVRQHHLIEMVRLAVGRAAGGAQWFDQRRRNDDEPEPQRGKKRLGECADIEDAATTVESLQA